MRAVGRSDFSRIRPSPCITNSPTSTIMAAARYHINLVIVASYDGIIVMSLPTRLAVDGSWWVSEAQRGTKIASQETRRPMTRRPEWTKSWREGGRERERERERERKRERGVGG